MFFLSNASLSTLMDLELMTYFDHKRAPDDKHEGASKNYRAVITELKRRGIKPRDFTDQSDYGFNLWENQLKLD
ncbi:MAG: hypothetical protein A2381_15260 [Bdellovibrionales bacterium RIFOXYB1_FULL_37_110]|nr:MAG: hypothetical protein A2381_15260 [Bdellovibrionales bacterium RIFOXYB1_FULL_37_110]